MKNLLPSERFEQIYKEHRNKNRMGENASHPYIVEMKIRAILLLLDEMAGKPFKKLLFALVLTSLLASPVMAQEYKECISEGQKITVLDPTSNREFFFRSKYYSDIKSLQKTTLNGEDGWLLEWELAGDKVKS